MKMPIHAHLERFHCKNGEMESFNNFIPLGMQYPGNRSYESNSMKNWFCGFGSGLEQNFGSSKNTNHARVIIYPFAQWLLSFLACVVMSPPKHNHSCQILCHTVRGFWSPDPQCSPISVGLVGLSYNNVSTTVLYTLRSDSQSCL